MIDWSEEHNKYSYMVCTISFKTEDEYTEWRDKIYDWLDKNRLDITWWGNTYLCTEDNKIKAKKKEIDELYYNHTGNKQFSIKEFVEKTKTEHGCNKHKNIIWIFRDKTITVLVDHCIGDAIKIGVEMILPLNEMMYGITIKSKNISKIKYQYIPFITEFTQLYIILEFFFQFKLPNFLGNLQIYKKNTKLVNINYSTIVEHKVISQIQKTNSPSDKPKYISCMLAHLVHNIWRVNKVKDKKYLTVGIVAGLKTDCSFNGLCLPLQDFINNEKCDMKICQKKKRRVNNYGIIIFNIPKITNQEKLVKYIDMSIKQKSWQIHATFELGLWNTIIKSDIELDLIFNPYFLPNELPCTFKNIIAATIYPSASIYCFAFSVFHKKIYYTTAVQTEEIDREEFYKNLKNYFQIY